MKIFFNWLLVAVCLFTVGNVQVMADGEEEVRLPILIGTGEVLTGDDARDGGVIPFIAYYQNGTIYINTFAEFSSVAVTVENETTGQVWNTTTDISDGMGEISIINGGTGSYTVEVITEFGECFVGSLRLQ